jgi:2'-hydroxyisoflavone reductase
MNRILLLGGTAWLGREIALRLVENGDAVTCVARGESGEIPDGVTFVEADRDDDDALRPLTETAWHAVIDVSRQPGQVKRAVRDLRHSTDSYVFVSSVNAYADQGKIGQDEDAALLPPLDGDVMESMATYGEAKVACEQAVISGFGLDRSLVARVGLIGGPDDIFGRSGYWPLRFSRPSTPDGTVLVPYAPDLLTQVIDVRDLAAWLVATTVERGSGVYNATGETFTFDDHIEVARRVAGHTGPLATAQPEWLHEQGVEEWAGEKSLPLWLDDPEWRGLNARTNDRARAAGLTLRPLAETLADTLTWEVSTGVDKPRRAGLPPADEAHLLAALAEATAQGRP